VKSPDFGEDEIIGELNIEPLNGKYSFDVGGALADKSVIPPFVFDLAYDQQLLVI